MLEEKKARLKQLSKNSISRPNVDQHTVPLDSIAAPLFKAFVSAKDGMLAETRKLF